VTPPIDFDTPWKEALGEYFQQCLALLFPAVHAGIDWRRAPIFLDTELQQVVRDAESGRRHVDRLVRVWLLGGGEAWLLIHVEIQSQQQAGFAKRMYVYHYRIFDRYEREVVSLAVLADDEPGWRPDTYERSRWGCELRFRFPVAKLQDWAARQVELLASENPFATFVLAHLVAQETRGDQQRRRRAKWGLTRRLYERGYTQEQVLSLYRVIDWLLALAPEEEALFLHEIERYEEEHHMPYITSAERYGLEKGLQQGLQKGRGEAKREDISRIVQARFGQAPKSLEERLANADEATLDELLVRAATVSSVDAL